MLHHQPSDIRSPGILPLFPSQQMSSNLQHSIWITSWPAPAAAYLFLQQSRLRSRQLGLQAAQVALQHLLLLPLP